MLPLPDPFKQTRGPLFEPTIWFSIGTNGVTSINIAKAEMGQHIGTALARILADELEADWSQVRLVSVDTDPKWGPMITGGSTSVWSSYPDFSRAGAAGRMTLIEEGAKLLGVDPLDCVARQGRVVASDRSIGYGEIVRRGDLSRRFSADELKALKIKTPDKRTLIGRPTRALDIPPKTKGEAVYGIDAEVENMVFARPKLPPTRYGSKVLSIDDSAARKVKGYLRSTALDDPSGTVPGWVMVIAETYPAAVRATELVQVAWQNDETAQVSDNDLQAHASRLIADPAAGAVLDTGGGDAASAFGQAKTTVEATYTTAGVLHFQLEPVNALAFEKDGVMEIHTGNQAQSFILPVLSKALGLPPEKIVMRTYLIGGGFGRRLNGDYSVPAALAAKALRRPVKMILTRADDSVLDSIRSPTVQTLKIGFDADRRPVVMDHAAVAGWPTKAMFPVGLVKGTNGALYDPFSIAGADHWYDVGVLRVRAINNDLAQKSFRPGWLRAVAPGWTNWALESFMDEAARSIGQDPLVFRLARLTGRGINAGSAPNAVGGANRQANVLRRVAERAGWGRSLPANTGLGLASSFGQERGMPTWCACAAEVEVDRRAGVVAVRKLWLDIDAGTIIDPDGARAQAEGAMLWGLSMALHEGTDFANGKVRDTNLDTYTPVRISDVPEFDIAFVDSVEAPMGLGEPPTTVVAPAIGNAIFAATGIRLRRLPIRPGDLLAAART
ncbi:xanthine dehydrogenase family protein molybdopterin-binding subunit [Bradyrhizobium japonicum]|uniref:xanthine dehydrogenase family protein molybdopterin-binding subunit n=1 Tax=Bradyrhizobium japonicum TaxID=375 RepID=UPI001FDA0084|nr:molybdopterin cofactor-binding domain-containing protein [Bradyrhizobium japonicum]